jgi:hypothetical protein
MFKAFSNDGIAMVLFKQEGHSIIKKNFFLFQGQSSSLIEFSLDGSLFAIFLKDKQEIRVLKVEDDIISLIPNMI